MAKITIGDIAEAAHLRAAVKQLEAALATGGIVVPGISGGMLLGRLLDDAKRRIADLQDKEEVAAKEEREKVGRDVACAVMAQREAALSAAEQEEYAGFLSQAFFTRADFGKLEEFYKSAWDRLSEDGKAEMSHRIWEGVRRKEYEFSELPDIVKQKEAERLQGMLLKGEKMPEDLKRIPESDRQDFLDALQSGRRAEAYQVLNRPAFAENVARTPSSVSAESVAVTDSKVASKVVQTESTQRKPEESKSGNAAGEAELKLDDLKLVNADAVKVTAPLADFKANGPKGKGH